MTFLQKNLNFIIYRDIIRFLSVVFFIPWFPYFYDIIFTGEIELETELAVIITVFLFGSFWCGYICPFGNMSYFISKIREKLFPRLEIKIPAQIDKPLRYIKYLLLLAFLYVFFILDISYFWDDHGKMYSSTLFTQLYISVKKWAILVIPFFIPRFFCKYLCFQKAGYNIVNTLLPITKIHRNDKTCLSCKKCEKQCPMKIEITKYNAIAGKDCVGCYSCMNKNVCPKDIDALELRFLGIKTNIFLFTLVAMFIYYILTTYIFLKYM